MQILKTIKVIEVEIAQLYQQSDSNKKEKLNTLIKLFFQSDFAQKSITEVMQDISEEAQEKGLTPEILESILNDEKYLKDII